MHRSLIALIFLGVAATGATPSFASSFKVTTLATNATDPGLINPWGLAASATSPLWIGVNGSGTSEIYNGAGVKQALVVTIPGDGSVTGVVFSGVAGAFNGDTFLFASEDGTFSGWRGALGAAAETLAVGSPDNVYKGLALATIGANTYSYLANFKAGTIDVMKGTGAAPDLTGSFTDPTLPAGYAPFNIQNLGGTLYVTYAVQDAAKEDDVAGAGNGIVDRFDLQGNFLGRVVTGGDLNSPWGLALAPVGFGDLAGALLVGNFGDGLIHAYDPLSGFLRDTLVDEGNSPIVIDGLWALRFGSGAANGGSATALYFTAGPDEETGGQFGVIAAVPEPATLVLVGSGLLAGLVGRRRRVLRRRADLNPVA